MNSIYQEIPPPDHLARFVECFWTSTVDVDHLRRVLPDGCVDLLFIFDGRELADARVVGAMTRPHDVSVDRGRSLLGVRFQPGMARACIRAEISALGDRSVSVRSALGPAGRRLSNAIAGVSITEDRVALLAGQLSVPTKMTTVQQAIHELARQPGRLSLADVADAARIGERQLRRNCLAESGLSPKQLARILRFRHAADILSRENQDLTTIALDCGYYDQAHLNRDFRQLAGTTPAKYSRLRRS